MEVSPKVSHRPPPLYLTIPRIHLIHDLQPYQCTYPDCGEPDRTYGSRQEWLTHEGLTHERVWCCSTHVSDEFETQLDYLRHLDDEHASESTPRSPELVAACMRPSAIPHRSCPLCPMSFVAVAEMQNHIAYHLERFALLALPKQSELDGGSESSSEGSIQTGEAAARVPKSIGGDSRAHDFDRSKPLELKDTIEEDIEVGKIVELTNTAMESFTPLELAGTEATNPQKSTIAWLHNLPHSDQMAEVDAAPTAQPAWMFLPTRLIRPIKVEDWSDYDPSPESRLLLREEIENSKTESADGDRRYTVLGPGLVYKSDYTLESNIAERRRGFQLSGILWNAAASTRTLGIAYLWVPEICVIQDDKNDREREASYESEIYSHATHTWLTKEDMPQRWDRLLKAERTAYERHSGRTRSTTQAAKETVDYYGTVSIV
jgi:hypothetical protein